MQALLRTFYLDHPLGEFEKSRDFDDGDFDQVTSTVLNFLSFILPEENSQDETGKLLEESLTKLRLDPNFHFPKTLKDEYFPNHTYNMRTEIDLSIFSDDVLRQGFPGQSLSELRDHPVIRRRGVDVVKGSGGMPSQELFFCLGSPPGWTVNIASIRRPQAILASARRECRKETTYM
jgi:hypothetical protein